MDDSFGFLKYENIEEYTAKDVIWKQRNITNSKYFRFKMRNNFCRCQEFLHFHAKNYFLG